MLTYKKENGFPLDILIETVDAKDKKKEPWVRYESVVTDPGGNVIDTFFHSSFRARVHWANGFFKGLKYHD